MAGVTGLFGSVICMEGGTTPMKVEGIGEWSLDIAMTTNETTEFGDEWKTRLAGLREASGSFSGNGVHGGTIQGTLRSNMLAGSVVFLRLYEANGKFWGIPEAYLTGMGRSISVEGKLETSFNFEASGTINYT